MCDSVYGEGGGGGKERRRQRGKIEHSQVTKMHSHEKINQTWQNLEKTW